MFFAAISGSMKDKPFQQQYLHLQQQQQQQHQQQQHQQKSLSDEVDSSRSSGEAKRPNPDKPKDPAGGDGSTIEVAKRPRGRPPGSKNKPKPLVVIARDADPSPAAMRPHVFEIPSGHDVADSLAQFARRRNLGVCVISGTGSVANVTLRQPQLGGLLPAAAPATIALRGRFEILSISATFFPPAVVALSPAAAGGGVSISLAAPQGQVIGGTVAGPLVAAGTVVVVAAAFENPTFHRLPVEEDVAVSVSVSGSGDMEEHDYLLYNQQQQQDHLLRRQQGPPTTESSGGMRIYGSHVASDVLWAPTARAPQPPQF